jgi:thiol:disulfide interchange protein DsbD
MNWKADSLKICLSLLLLGVGAVACTSTTAGPTIAWQSYDPAAVDRARQEERPVILEFYADWCVPCKELERFTFSDQRVIESTEAFVRLRVDLSDYDSPESVNLRRKYEVTGVPEIMFLDTQGSEVHDARVIGFLGANDFLQRLKKARFSQSWTDS